MLKGQTLRKTFRNEIKIKKVMQRKKGHTCSVDVYVVCVNASENYTTF